MNDFEKEQVSFMAEMREHMRNQTLRCNSHATNIKALDDRTTALETSKDYAKGALKTIGVGVPAVGSLAWCAWILFKDLRGN